MKRPIQFVAQPPILFSIYLAFLGGSYLPYFAFLPIRISFHIIMTIILIRWLWTDGLPATPLLWPLGITGVVTFISALNAIDPRIALENWWHWLINGLLMLMLVSWMRRNWGEKLLKAHFGIAGVIVAVCWLQWLIYPYTRPGGAFGLINLTGAYAAVLLLPAFVWWWEEKRPWLLSVAVGLATVIAMNDSRGAYISAGVALVAFLFLRYRVKLPVLLVGLSITVLLAFGVISKTTGGHAAGDVIRMDLWRSAVTMLKAHPLTGVGPGMFGQAYRTYRTGTDDNMIDSHNAYLNILAELGLPGALASGLTGWAFLRSIARKRTMKQDAILAALAGVAVHLLFDSFPITNFVFVVNLYVAYLVSSVQPTMKPAWKTAMTRALTAVLMLYAASFAFMDYAQSWYEQSLAKGSIVEAEIAASLDPNNRLYQIQVARLEGDENRVRELDPTLSPTTRLDVYGIISFGRFLW